MTFAERLRAFRGLMGVSQRWVAREAGISDSFLCQLETGHAASPSAAVLERLADVFGVSMETLWRGSDPAAGPPPPPCPECRTRPVSTSLGLCAWCDNSQGGGLP